MMTYDYNILLNKDKQRRLAFIMLHGGYVEDSKEVMDVIDALPSKSVKKLVNVLSLGNRGTSTVNICERLLTVETKDFQNWLNLAYRNAEIAYYVQGDHHSDHVDLVDSIMWHSQNRNITKHQEKNLIFATAAALSLFGNNFDLYSKKEVAYANIPVGKIKRHRTFEVSVLDRDGDVLQNRTMVLSSETFIDYVLSHNGDSAELYKAIIAGQSLSPTRVAAILSSQAFVAPLAGGAL